MKVLERAHSLQTVECFFHVLVFVLPVGYSTNLHSCPPTSAVTDMQPDSCHQVADTCDDSTEGYSLVAHTEAYITADARGFICQLYACCCSLIPSLLQEIRVFWVALTVALTISSSALMGPTGANEQTCLSTWDLASLRSTQMRDRRCAYVSPFFYACRLALGSVPSSHLTRGQPILDVHYHVLSDFALICALLLRRSSLK